MSDEYPLMPPPSSVRMSLFAQGVDVTFKPGGVPADAGRGLVASEVVESFGVTMETRVATRFGFGLDERRAETGAGA
jgi:hypothetical protein